MTGMTQVSDEQLFAYVDGELDEATAAHIEAAVARDDSLAARVAQQRQLRQRLREEFDPVAHESVPDRLLQALEPVSVADIRTARGRKSAGSTRRWSWQEWGAMAATLVLGLVTGISYQGPVGKQPLRAQEGGLVASGYLDNALTHLPGGKADDNGTTIGLSIKSTSGEYCRSFTMPQSAGLACRRGRAWVVDTLAATAPGPDQSEFRQAASFLPDAVRVAIEQRMYGEPLTELEEAMQLKAQWRPEPGPGAR